MALSPQIDAWLATDPFTPQCHFEEDRLFVTGSPPELRYINQGQFEDIDDGDYSEIVWSPNGEHVIFPVNQYEYHLYSGEELVQIYDDERNVSRVWWWSPNSKYVARVNEDRELIVVDFETNNSLEKFNLGELYYGPIWSPNSKYLIVHEMDNYFLFDVENQLKYLFTPTSQITNFPVWSNNSEKIYYFKNTDLVAYDIKSDTTVKLITDIDGIAVKYIDVSPNDKHVVVHHFNNSLILNTQTREVQSISGFHGWLADDKILQIRTMGGMPFNKHVEIYDLNIAQSETIYTYSQDMERVDISPSNRFILIATQMFFNGLTRTMMVTSFILYDTEHHQYVRDIEFKNDGWLEWITQDNQDWLVIREKLNNKDTSPYLTYMYNPAENKKCKLGWTTYSLEFQP